MNRLSIAVLMLLLSACDLKYRPDKYKNEGSTEVDQPTRSAKPTSTPKNTSPAPIKGERVNQSAIVRDQPNGEPIVSLLDYVPLRCAPVKKDWYQVNVDFDISKDEFSKPIFRKGRKIEVNGVPAGTLERDIKLPVATNGEKMWATINGYTEKKSLRSGSIIESALSVFLNQHKGRSTQDMQPFIHNFQLEEETVLKPYVLFLNYESGIDDPSPLYRLALIFQGQQLIGILHSRPFELAGSNTRRLQRGFTVNFLNGIDQTLREDFATKFNKFIVSVD
ncbi:hypothetical protein DVR12_06465 [Chitinophaga silvatica]|uniref:Lipoprotein n=1 Tax=Chitinophaga silvatica TaxID=2282649 RepID=A0A3E1YE50_9BACT|nr:hypothetical protein [Chitinophaga silvatica]RFS24832.1 hypothetical protein DVR12_06465 [Chitinophaga silvatica]